MERRLGGESVIETKDNAELKNKKGRFLNVLEESPDGLGIIQSYRK
jgi:hypothetical protein